MLDVCMAVDAACSHGPLGGTCGCGPKAFEKALAEAAAIAGAAADAMKTDAPRAVEPPPELDSGVEQRHARRRPEYTPLERSARSLSDIL